MPVLVAVLVLVILIIFASCIKIVPQATALVMERLAAGLIDYYRGEKLVLINKSATPMDGRADLVIAEPIGEALGIFL